MMPRIEGNKIGIVENNELRNEVIEPDIVWIEKYEESNAYEYSVIDSSYDNEVRVISDRICTIQCDEKLKSSLVDAIVSLFIRERIMDIDYIDIREVWKDKCQFSCISGKEDWVLSNLEQWIEELSLNHPGCNDRVIFQIDGDISLFEVQDVIDVVDQWNDKQDTKFDIWYSAAYVEGKDDIVRVSVWFQ